MALAFRATPVTDETRAFGALALIVPLLQRFGIVTGKHQAGAEDAPRHCIFDMLVADCILAASD